MYSHHKFDPKLLVNVRPTGVQQPYEVSTNVPLPFWLKGELCAYKLYHSSIQQSEKNLFIPTAVEFSNLIGQNFFVFCFFNNMAMNYIAYLFYCFYGSRSL